MYYQVYKLEGEHEMFSQNRLFIAWVISFLATIGSLFFSEVLKLQPCNLCWYQRILMYPLVVIILVGILIKANNIKFFVIPFSILGIIISSYHIIIQQISIPVLNACDINNPCTHSGFKLFGVFTIPMLSFMAFVSITLLLSTRKK
ncbi:disulfide bond formation protein B [Paenibacillus sp. WLX2291]|uniref:disulfide bond formation protein B n=1 Tax=Paenibacillus sp. WLX2291 TaxID=3296934 RepID=UPI00398413C3